MKLSIFKKVTGLWLVMLATTVAHANDIQLGIPSYGGSGCPGGSVAASLSPDSKNLSLIFDQFITEVGRSVGKTLDRKNCQISIPIHVPQGITVSIVAIDYRGFVSLPQGAMARFSSEYFIGGSSGPRFSRDFLGAQDTDYLVTDTLGVIGQVWSACGASANLRVSTSMLVKTNRYNEDATATVDSADVSAGIVYKLQWKRCSR
jgi:hypothetical protein